mgnify:CR=1 FL=1
MKLLSFEAVNILSFGGDEVVKIDFEENGIDLIVGDNGIGKSNLIRIIKMIYFFDYPSKIEKIVNDHKEHGSISCVTMSKGVKYKIDYVFTRKKIKSIEVFKNDSIVAEDTGHLSSTKDWISKHIVDIPKDVFYNVFIPSIDTFKSFIGMNAEDSRKIRDELFSLSAINTKAEAVKDKLYELNKSNNAIESIIAATNEAVTRIDGEIDDAKKSIDDTSKSKIEELTTQISDCDKIIKDKGTEQSQKNTQLQTYNDHLDYYSKINTQSLLDGSKKEVEELDKSIGSSNKIIEDNNEILIDINTLEKIRERGEHEKFEVDKSKEIDTIDADVLVLTNKIELTKKHNSWLRSNELKSLVSGLDGKISEKNGTLETRVIESTEKLESLNSKRANLTILKRDIDILKLGDKCPTCDQKLTFDEKTLKEKIGKYNSDAIVYNDDKSLLEKYNLETKSIKEDRDKLDSEKKGYDTELLNMGSVEEVVCEEVVDIKKTEEQITEKTEKKHTLNGEITGHKNNIKLLVEYKLEIVPTQTREEVEEVIKTNNGIVTEKTEKKGSISTNISGYEIELAGFVVDEEERPTKEVCLKEISKLSDEISLIKTDIENETKKKTGYDSLKKDYESKKSSDVLTSLTESIDEEKQKIKDKQKESDELVEEIEQYEALKYVYSENGLKKWILNKIKHGFSSNVNKDLEKFNLSVDFDDNFTMGIYKNGRDLDPKLMSVGQKKIIDTVVCLNFIELYSKKIGDINFCILDECLSNLSKRNSELLLSVVHDKLIDKGFNIKITNHAPLTQHIFKKTINLVDNFGYTEVS